jgi:hypothetical protein
MSAALCFLTSSLRTSSTMIELTIAAWSAGRRDFGAAFEVGACSSLLAPK